MKGFNNLGPLVAVAGGYKIRNGGGFFSGNGFPKSGTAGTGVGRDGKGYPTGSMYMDDDTGVVFVNEGSATSPYWTPSTFDQRGLLGWYSDFRDGAGKAVADTATTATLIGSGLRVHGDGIEATDSGLTVAMTATDGKGAVGSLIATAADAKLACLSVGVGTTPVFQADQNGTYVVDTLITNSSAITLRAVFCGFCGSAADAIAPLMTYSGTTLSFAATQADDIAGLTFSSELTATDRWFAPHDKANTNASIETTATGVDTGVTVAAAGTYQRLRVECDANGTVRMFIDKALEATFTAALDVDEEMHPMLYVESTSTATKTILVRHFATWGRKA